MYVHLPLLLHGAIELLTAVCVCKQQTVGYAAARARTGHRRPKQLPRVPNNTFSVQYIVFLTARTTSPIMPCHCCPSPHTTYTVGWGGIMGLRLTVAPKLNLAEGGKLLRAGPGSCNAFS